MTDLEKLKECFDKIGQKYILFSKDEFFHWENDPSYYTIWIGNSYCFGFLEDGSYIKQ